MTLRVKGAVAAALCVVGVAAGISLGSGSALADPDQAPVDPAVVDAPPAQVPAPDPAIAAPPPDPGMAPPAPVLGHLEVGSAVMFTENHLRELKDDRLHHRSPDHGRRRLQGFEFNALLQVQVVARFPG